MSWKGDKYVMRIYRIDYLPFFNELKRREEIPVASIEISKETKIAIEDLIQEMEGFNIREDGIR